MEKNYPATELEEIYKQILQGNLKTLPEKQSSIRFDAKQIELQVSTA